MRYATARRMIRTGDLVAFREQSGVIPALTRIISRSPYTKAGVAVWVECGSMLRLFVVLPEIRGASPYPLSNYRHLEFDVFRSPVNRESVHVSAWNFLGWRVRPVWSTLLRITSARWLRWPAPKTDGGLPFYHDLPFLIYRLAGWRHRGLFMPQLPADIVRAIGERPMIEVRIRD